MEQTTTTTTTQIQPVAPQGKGMATAGFVISLIALVFYFVIAIAVAAQALMGGGYALGIFWIVLSLVGTGLCVMGMMQLGKTGGKRGLAIAGMICGLIALILTTMLVMGIGKMQSAGTDMGDKWKEAIEQSGQQMQSEMNQATDTVQGEAH